MFPAILERPQADRCCVAAAHRNSQTGWQIMAFNLWSIVIPKWDCVGAFKSTRKRATCSISVLLNFDVMNDSIYSLLLEYIFRNFYDIKLHQNLICLSSVCGQVRCLSYRRRIPAEQHVVCMFSFMVAKTVRRITWHYVMYFATDFNQGMVVPGRGNSRKYTKKVAFKSCSFNSW